MGYGGDLQGRSLQCVNPFSPSYACHADTRCTEEITDSDIFVNCIYLTSKIPNFGEHLSTNHDFGCQATD